MKLSNQKPKYSDFLGDSKNCHDDHRNKMQTEARRAHTNELPDPFICILKLPNRDSPFSSEYIHVTVRF